MSRRLSRTMEMSTLRRRLRRHRRVALLVGATLVGCTNVRGQAAVTQFSLSAGSATDARGLRSSTFTASPGIVFSPVAPLTMAVSASGSRFEGSDWQAGVDAGLSARSREWRHATLTVDGTGSYARTSFNAEFAVGEATPALEVRFGPLTAFGGARLAAGQTKVRGTPPADAPAAPVILTSITRSSHGPVYGAHWQVAGGDMPLVLSFREDRARIAHELVVDRTASATIALGRLTLAGSAGRRVSATETMAVSSGSATLAIAPGLSLLGSVGRYPSSRLTGAAAGRYVSLGAFLQSGAPRPVRLPRPAGIPAARGGITRLSIRAADAGRVELAGDWNDWTPVPATRAANGVWYADLPLAPGEYRYAFRVDGGAWRVPDGAVTSDDGFGGRSAYVTVVRVVASSTSHNQEER